MSSEISRLPYDAIVAIAQRIDSFNDFLTFAGVCTLWRSAAMEANKYNLGPSHYSSWPWLLLADNSPNQHDDVSCCRELFSVPRGMIFKASLGGTKNKRSFASKGWLINVGYDGKDITISLLHPLSGSQITLPHLTSSLDYQDGHVTDNDLSDPHLDFVRKAVLSSSSSSTAILMIIYDDYFRLAFCNLGAHVREWTAIETRPAPFDDVIFFKGYFYAIAWTGVIVECDVTGATPTLARILTYIPSGMLRCGVFVESVYLVESTAKLWIVSRLGVRLLFKDEMTVIEEGVEFIKNEHGQDCIYGTYDFQVLEYDLSSDSWREVKHLGDRALFLGHSSSFSIQGDDSIKSNCIYFTDDDTDAYPNLTGGGGRDMGIYNFEDKSVTPHFKGISLSPVTPPMWIALC